MYGCNWLRSWTLNAERWMVRGNILLGHGRRDCVYVAVSEKETAANSVCNRSFVDVVVALKLNECYRPSLGIYESQAHLQRKCEIIIEQAIVFARTIITHKIIIGFAWIRCVLNPRLQSTYFMCFIILWGDFYQNSRLTLCNVHYYLNLHVNFARSFERDFAMPWEEPKNGFLVLFRSGDKWI